VRSIDLGGEAVKPHRFLYSAVFLVGILGQFIGGNLTDRFSPEILWLWVLPMFPVIALLYIPAAKTGGLIAIGSVSVLLGFFMFLLQPINQAAVSAYSESSGRGMAFGFTFLGVFGIGALGAPLTGVILQFYNQTVLFVSMAIISFITLVAGLFLYLFLFPDRAET